MRKNFNEIIASVKQQEMKKIVVAAAQDEHVLEAVNEAKKRGIVTAILVGDEKKIREIAQAIDMDLNEVEIIDEPDAIEASLKAVKLARDGKADMYMKGLMETRSFLMSILDKEVGLRSGELLSHAAVLEMPGMNRLLFLTDAAFIAYPTLEEKVGMIKNLIPVCRACGIEVPKVAPVAAVETVNPKMPVTVEAAELTKMNEEGKITGCIVDGPLSFDLATDAEAAKAKGISDRKIQGDADILVFPDVHAGNFVYKALVRVEGVKSGCILMGSKVPCILTSRSDSIETKINSIALAAVAANELTKNS